MRIIDRYILKHFIPSFLWCLGIFLFLYVIMDLFGHIDEIVRERIPLTTLAYYYLTFTPLIFVQTSPIAVLLATIYNLSNLNKNNEITAMKASGINIWKVLRPILLTSFLISILVFVVNDKIAPQSMKMSSEIKEELIEKKTKTQSKQIKNIAIYARKNRIIYAGLFDVYKKQLQDIVVHEHDRFQNLTSKISASSAKYVEGQWLFRNALISKVNNQGQFIEDPKFYNKTIIDIEEKPEDFLKREWRAEFMNYKELRQYINLFSGGPRKTLDRLYVDLYYKISFPLISFIIVFVGAPFALQIRRGGVLRGIGLGIIISLAYYAFSAIILAFGKASILSPIVAAWLGNIVFGIFGFINIQKLR